MRVLVIPDVHAHPDYDHERLKWLGRLIVQSKIDGDPYDEVIQLGDWADMPSLSSYDKGKRSFEGRRYWRDVKSAIDAQKAFFGPLEKYNKKRRKFKEKQWRPKLVMTLGNHEDRISRVTQDFPELYETIGIRDLQLEQFGWEVYPYQIPYTTHGIAFCHCFATGISGRPISGVNHARMLCNKLHASAVVGHSHLVDWAEQARVDGTKFFGLVAGCYSHPNQIEGWNLATEHLWWRGVVELNDLDGEGYYDEMRHITMRKLKRVFG